MAHKVQKSRDMHPHNPPKARVTPFKTVETAIEYQMVGCRRRQRLADPRPTEVQGTDIWALGCRREVLSGRVS